MQELKFDELTHTYTVDGVVKPSVTQVMSRVATRSGDDQPWKSISGWENFQGCQTNTDFGTAFHSIAAYKLKKLDFAHDEAMDPWIHGLNTFLDDFPAFETRAIEQAMYSKLGFCGTADWIAQRFGDWFVIDWKTGGQISKTSRLQTAAYEQMARETLNIPAKAKVHRWTVRIFEGGYQLEKRTAKDRLDWLKFQSILNVYQQFSQ